MSAATAAQVFDAIPMFDSESEDDDVPADTEENSLAVVVPQNEEEASAIAMDDAIGAAEDEPAVVAIKAKKKIERLDVRRLIDDKKGIEKLLKTAQNIRFKGHGHERADLRNLMLMYEEWGYGLLSGATFRDFAGKVQKLGRTREIGGFIHAVRTKLRDSQRSDSSSDESDGDESGSGGATDEEDQPTPGYTQHPAPQVLDRSGAESSRIIEEKRQAAIRKRQAKRAALAASYQPVTQPGPDTQHDHEPDDADLFGDDLDEESLCQVDAALDTDKDTDKDMDKDMDTNEDMDKDMDTNKDTSVCTDSCMSPAAPA